MGSQCDRPRVGASVDSKPSILRRASMVVPTLGVVLHIDNFVCRVEMQPPFVLCQGLTRWD